MPDPSIPFPASPPAARRARARRGAAARCALGLLALGVLAAAAGCGGDTGPTVTETDEPLYREALQLKREGRTQEALADYLKVIVKRGDLAPESHLEAGLIEMLYVHDNIAAIYHFRRYLELEPNSPQAANVKGLIDTAERNFARTLPGLPMETASGGGASLEEVARLQQENSELRAQLAALRASSAPPPPVYPAPAASASAAAEAAPAPPAADAPAPVAVDEPAPGPPAAAPAPPPAQGRRYTVQPHDTLFGIAKRFYHTATNARVQAILQANRGVLPSAAALRPGMQLTIP